MSKRARSVGFTLIEAVMAIVITGILAGIVAVFITKPVTGYVDAVRRAELTDAADVALRRIARDVRRTLPNSLRTVTNGFEFVVTKSGGRYRESGDGSTGGIFLNWTDTTACITTPNNCKFDVLGTLPAMAANDHVVIFNLGADYSPADVYGGGNRAQVASIAGNTVTLAANPYVSQSPPLPSPSARFQVVDANELVVRYVCNGGVLTRFSGCSLATPSVCSGAGDILAGSSTTEPKASCSIDYASAATGRNGLLYISLTLTDTPSGESVTLFQQIHVDNAP